MGRGLRDRAGVGWGRGRVSRRVNGAHSSPLTRRGNGRRRGADSPPKLGARLGLAGEVGFPPRSAVVGEHRGTEDQAPTILVLGYFDGLHLGHQALFEKARALASEKMRRFLS